MGDILLSFFCIIAAGAAMRRLRPGGLNPEQLRLNINTSVFNLFLPALCISVFVQTPLTVEAALIPLTALITLFAVTGLSLIVFRYVGSWLKLSDKSIGALIIVSTMGNVTYLGLPVLTGLYGPGSARYALYYDLLATTPFLWLVGVQLGSRYGGTSSPGFVQALTRLISLPPLWGIAIGISINLLGIPLPLFVTKALGMLGGVVVPLMIFSIGLSLSFTHSRHSLALVPAAVLKLVVSPVISLFAGKMLGLQGTALSAAFLEGGMPTMVLSILIAAEFGLDVELAALSIVVTTLLAFITLPVIIHITGML